MSINPPKHTRGRDALSVLLLSTFSLCGIFCGLTLLLQQMANRSYLKSQKLKATETDRQKISLPEAENAALKKDKAALKQRVRMLKEVIQKNRGGLLSWVRMLSFLIIQVLMSFCCCCRRCWGTPEGAERTSGGCSDRCQVFRFRRRVWWEFGRPAAEGFSEVCRVLGRSF